jgi:hypothetical protein
MDVVFNATFNNISVISWRSVLLVETKTGVPGENHRSLKICLSHNVVSSTPRHDRVPNSQLWWRKELIACTSSCKFNEFASVVLGLWSTLITRPHIYMSPFAQWNKSFRSVVPEILKVSITRPHIYMSPFAQWNKSFRSVVPEILKVSTIQTQKKCLHVKYIWRLCFLLHQGKIITHNSHSWNRTCTVHVV